MRRNKTRRRKDKTPLRWFVAPRPYRIFYAVTATDPNTHKTATSNTHRDIKARSAQEALEKLRKNLDLQSERNTKDWGGCLFEYSDFKVALVCQRCHGRGHLKFK
ncbi:MAG: hypothetical protein UY12_C0012G0011 [Parcubacteria group bacterium GW2011_GWA2_47_8b]|uniref:Uncharacterized protein n=2 Tax=Candidatus Harrisoniibacteriota TaxID=1817905 RepID=A0A1G1ZX50_9BACT|nr:MAG: hypothetical protein UY12_C0012G0011 [Parcubacteria group bacterium GW2011_GWA2_47_8b]OGY64479.1 MAG: hypothetical protein A3E64_02615 [Candidatus Harrisonbacteria bacterium RIFCSPHIGHO2_12_FULL_48_16]OGY68457.1 MAG: hypothetical protein A2214_00435 [Candidatus Harrisonbacteria bacterium RIFOXYA1_FULL_48_8]